MKHALSLGLVLYGVWLLWSGHYGRFLLLVGAASCVAVVSLAWRLRLVDAEGAPVEVALRAMAYAPWLVWQIFRSNVDVSLRILAPTLPISPRLIRIRAGQRSDLGRVVYANSITLTPGTVSVHVHGDEITVHALSVEAARELGSGEMDRRVASIEGAP